MPLKRQPRHAYRFCRTACRSRHFQRMKPPRALCRIMPPPHQPPRIAAELMPDLLCRFCQMMRHTTSQRYGAASCRLFLCLRRRAGWRFAMPRHASAGAALRYASEALMPRGAMPPRRCAADAFELPVPAPFSLLPRVCCLMALSRIIPRPPPDSSTQPPTNVRRSAIRCRQRPLLSADSTRR